MGANITRRLKHNGHECVVYDVSVGAVPGAKPKAPTARSRPHPA
jgi:6-phosphogluconate dehydrogenase (decarboxylating)